MMRPVAVAARLQGAPVKDAFRPPDEQLEFLRSGLEAIITEEELLGKLARSRQEGRPLRVKQGFDPTAPDIHLGHTVGLRILKRFQDLGHHIVLIVGDSTALVGDPSGRKEARPRLTRETIVRNARTYQEQFFKVLDQERVEVRFNGEWFAKFGLEDILELSSHFTVARMLERDDFHTRFRDGIPIGLHEFLYPLMQGYDSVMVRADVEIGATEQTFNLLAGRSIQKDHGQEPQVALTYPVLPGLDGVRRMSKSLGNYVGVSEPPEEIYGKMMSIPDSVVEQYVPLVSGWSVIEQQEAIERFRTNPLAGKEHLAARIVELYHGGEEARRARDHFDRVVRRKEDPEEIPEKVLDVSESSIWLVRALKETGLAPSTSEARRLVESGAVTVDGHIVRDTKAELAAESGRLYQVKVGKRRYLRIRIGAWPSSSC
jgi:tyrosyl-tRNA synthetase